MARPDYSWPSRGDTVQTVVTGRVGIDSDRDWAGYVHAWFADSGRWERWHVDNLMRKDCKMSERCPDCGREQATNYHAWCDHVEGDARLLCFAHETDSDYYGEEHYDDCRDATITRLREQLAEARRRIDDLNERLAIADNELEQYR